MLIFILITSHVFGQKTPTNHLSQHQSSRVNNFSDITAGGNNTTVNATAGATILTPLTFKKTSDLQFGTMGESEGTGGTCVLTTTGSRTQTGGVYLSPLSPQKSNAA